MKAIQFSRDRRTELTGQIQSEFQATLDHSLSPFQADQILDLMIRTLGPGIYNQAVQDVRAHLQSKLDDLDGEIYIDAP